MKKQAEKETVFYKGIKSGSMRMRPIIWDKCLLWITICLRIHNATDNGFVLGMYLICKVFSGEPSKSEVAKSVYILLIKTYIKSSFIA
ncbi:hypothetical protein [Hymenobacter volaticus]|uniref:hypothetical protein n=1 Tax=Hymenobacter volaticus TaxID=2932254 RepID=UPI001FD7019C|nr:hypothetical protein [Hymenobacter volaticus]